MLHARHHVAAQSSSQSSCHLSCQHRVLAITLLCSPPGGMAQEIHANRARIIGAAGTGLSSHGEADAFLQRRVPRRCPHDGHRKRGRTSAHDSTRTVAERMPGMPSRGSAPPTIGPALIRAGNRSMARAGVSPSSNHSSSSSSICAMSSSAASGALSSPDRSLLHRIVEHESLQNHYCLEVQLTFTK